MSGISLVPVLIGMYAIGQVLVSASDESQMGQVRAFKKEKYSPASKSCGSMGGPFWKQL